MSEMGSHDPFGHLKHKLWPKEGPWVKLLIWLPTTKSQESPRFPCVQVACHISLESSRQGLQLCFRPHLNWRSADKVIGPKVAGIPTLGISGLPFGTLLQTSSQSEVCKQSHGSPNFGNFGTPIWGSRVKCHLDVGSVASHKVYYKWEGDGFPQVRVVVSLVSPNLLVVCPSTKSAQIMH
jgi:hypothetical protein